VLTLRESPCKKPLGAPFVSRSEHRDRVAQAASLIIETHSDALRRLGE
jgi:hypothetical protein